MDDATDLEEVAVSSVANADCDSRPLCNDNGDRAVPAASFSDEARTHGDVQVESHDGDAPAAEPLGNLKGRGKQQQAARITGVFY